MLQNKKVNVSGIVKRLEGFEEVSFYLTTHDEEYRKVQKHLQTVKTEHLEAYLSANSGLFDVVSLDYIAARTVSSIEIGLRVD